MCLMPDANNKGADQPAHPFSRDVAHLRLALLYLQKITSFTTVNFLSIRTPKQFVVITLKFELYGSTIE